jgi:hypothetical protein
MEGKRVWANFATIMDDSIDQTFRPAMEEPVDKVLDTDSIVALMACLAWVSA